MPDWLGLSVSRSSTEFFGDASTWATTFALPIFVSACCAILLCARSNRSMIVAFFLLTAFAFYMSLEPSLKIGAVKPVGSELGSLMPATYATMETGSAFLSEKIPRFRNMRASYRWLGLTVFGGWCMLLVGTSRANAKWKARVLMTLMFLVLLLNLPDMPRKIQTDTNHRSMFLKLDADLAPEVAGVTYPGGLPRLC